MLPIKTIYTDTRHKTDDSTCSSDFKTYLPNNITLPSNTTFYISDISLPVNWYTVKTGRHETIYFKSNGANCALSLCTLPAGNYNTTTLATALGEATHDNIQSQVLPSIDLFQTLFSKLFKYRTKAVLTHSRY